MPPKKRLNIENETPIACDRMALSKAVIAAAHAAGAQFGDKGLASYLEAQAIATPSPFLTLMSKAMLNYEAPLAPVVTRIELVAAPLKRDG